MTICKFVLLFAVVLTVIPSVLAVRVPFNSGYASMYATKNSVDEFSEGKALAFSFMPTPYIEYSDSCVVRQSALDDGCKSIGCINFSCSSHTHRWCARGWQPRPGSSPCTVLFSKTASNGFASAERASFKFEDASSGSCTYVCYTTLHPGLASLTAKSTGAVAPTPAAV